ncbi:hypothetical protein AWN76_016925 [Rhodothermaceae bacterium RA]|nr:hypothetical protein AWN76_016925 [Rhodothermaceae bacterium RA]
MTLLLRSLTAAALIGVAAGLVPPTLAQHRPSPPQTLHGLPLVFHDDFSGGAARWEATDPDAWMVVNEHRNPVFFLYQASHYAPPVRSPVNLAFVRDLWVSDFVMDVRVKSTSRSYDHRDMVFAYGWQSPSRFYYTHIAPAAREDDPHAHSIFRVHDAPRVSIATERRRNGPWRDRTYHTVRIVRDTQAGTITVYFDDLTTPIMTATDTTFTWGRLGVGSFDDTGMIDLVTVWGRTVEPPSTP